MPKVTINNLIIFGDSMSDIGNKRQSGMGRFARLISAMRTNDVGRYSDGRNWTDFLWQWAGGISMIQTDKNTSNDNTEVHRSLSCDSSQDSGFGRPIVYCNYAEGGAMGASDRSATGLGVFKDQLKRYFKERDAFPLTGNTMHILWFGLNDLVTNGRKPDTMDKVVEEMASMMAGIKMYDSKAHFMVIELPNPASAVRFLKKNDIKEALELNKGACHFNKHLGGLTNGHYYDGKDDVLLVAMYDWVDTVNGNLAKYHLENGAQPHGVKVNYGTLSDSTTHRRHVATSDDAHPTEAVYKLIAKEIARALVTKYELGILSRSMHVR